MRSGLRGIADADPEERFRRNAIAREALIEAVYRSEVDKLTASAQRYAATMQPLQALRTWMLLLVDHVEKKTLILPAMETVEGGSMRLIEGTKSQVHGAFLLLIQRAMRLMKKNFLEIIKDLVPDGLGQIEKLAGPGRE